MQDKTVWCQVYGENCFTHFEFWLSKGRIDLTVRRAGTKFYSLIRQEVEFS